MDMTVELDRPAALATLSDAERQPCEVWTRVMGYHRPVASFNIGKQGEFEARRYFAEPGRPALTPAPADALACGD